MRVHHVTTAANLVEQLVELWSGPRPDPFGFDLAVVPGAGFQRWLSQQLSQAGAEPGICAGVDFASVAALERRLAGPDDPWRPEQLVWSVQRLALAGDPELELLRRHLAASRETYTACLRIARQLAGYVFRPLMLRAWLDGADTGPNGAPLAENAWQAHLWRTLVAELGEDPLTRRETLLDRLRRGPVPELPARVAVIAPGRLDRRRVDLWEALGTHHEVDLLVLTPSPARSRAVLRLAEPDLRRAEFTRPSGHALNAALGAESDEAALLLPVPGTVASTGARETLLGWLQADLRTDAAGPRRVLPADDRSVRVHLSHGIDRQVEVLREALTELLADDPTLEPRDIVVLTPVIDAVAPLVGAAFTAPPGVAAHPAQRFRVQLADRTVAQVNPMVTLLLDLLRLPDSRVEASTLLELCAQPAIAGRFGFTADTRERLVDVVERSGVRWGLSAAHRAGYGLDAFPQNTWVAGLQRMLLGVTLAETDLVAAGTVLPLDDIESSDVALIGGLTELVGRLSRLLAELDRPTDLAGWAKRCRVWLSSLVSLAPSEDWQLSDLWAGLARLADRGGSAAEEVIGRPAVLRAVEQEFASSPARGAFGNGSLVVSGLNSLRHVPHRVVVLLGWDAEHYPRSTRRHGDDLLGDEPRVGDPSSALTDRQSLLDAVHAAGERLVVIAKGRSVATNEAVPLAAPLSELIEALDATAATASGEPAGRAVTVQHPLQPFDPRYFDHRFPDLASADPLAFRAAQATLAEPAPQRPRYELDPLPEPELAQGVGLDELAGYFNHPARTLLKVRAGLSLGEEREAGDSIPIEPDALARWQIGNRVLSRLRAGHDEATVERAEWLRGDVPPFALGTDLLSGVLAEARRSVRAVPRELEDQQLHDLDLAITVPQRGTVPLVGRVATHGHEIVAVEFSSLQPRHRLVAWLRLLALAAAEPGPWRARVIGKGRSAVYAAPPPLQARRLLGNYLALYSVGLSRPLPALPRVGSEWATMRSSAQDPLDPRTGVPRLRERWRYETENDPAWRALFSFPDVLDLGVGDLALPGADPAERTLVGALASSIWAPLQANEVSA